MTEARANATAALLQDGRVVITGGDNSGTPSNAIEIFDPSSGNFAFAGTLSSPRTKQAMTVLADGRVLGSKISDDASGLVPSNPPAISFHWLPAGRLLDRIAAEALTNR